MEGLGRSSLTKGSVRFIAERIPRLGEPKEPFELRWALAEQTARTVRSKRACIEGFLFERRPCLPYAPTGLGSRSAQAGERPWPMNRIGRLWRPQQRFEPAPPASAGTRRQRRRHAAPRQEPMFKPRWERQRHLYWLLHARDNVPVCGGMLSVRPNV